MSRSNVFAMLHAAQWWTVPPAREVSFLAGADPELLSISLDPLPNDAPAVVEFHPARGGRFGDYLEVLLNELDRVAVALFPRWLPGAERLDGAHGLGVEAVRVLAAQMAAQSNNFGPFLADLAERSLRANAGQPARRDAVRLLPAEVRAAGLARVVAATYGRESAAVLVHVPEALSSAERGALIAAAEWLAHHGRLGVWLAGGSLADVDRLRSVAITLPADLADLAVEAYGAGSEKVQPADTARPLFTYPPVSGVPRWDSEAEQALERALGRHKWSEGRHWNYTYEYNVLSRLYRLDLFWPVEGLVVEVDGAEHRSHLKYAEDRRRDVRLQLLGHDVLRFTNEQVLSDVAIVVLEIKQLLNQRRRNATNRIEMRQHVRR